MGFKENSLQNFRFRGYFVRLKGLEPPRRETPDPKSGAATNYATAANAIRAFLFSGAKIETFFGLTNKIAIKLIFQIFACYLDDCICLFQLIFLFHIHLDVGINSEFGMVHVFVEVWAGREANAPSVR